MRATPALPQPESETHYRLAVTTWKLPLTCLGATILGNQVNCQGLNGHNTTTSGRAGIQRTSAFLSPLEVLEQT